MSDLGVIGTDVGSDIAAHDSGFTVVWRTRSENVVRASFYDWSGNPLASDVFVEGRVSGGTGPDVRRPAVARHRAGIDQVVLAWIEPDRISAKACSTSGSCSIADIDVALFDTTGVDSLALVQLDDRQVARWRLPSGDVQLVSFDPTVGSTSTLLTIPASSDQNFHRMGAVEGASPSLLIGRTDDTGAAALLQIMGPDPLSWDASSGLFDWTTAGCTELGDPALCGTLALLAVGPGRVDEQSLLLVDVTLGADGPMDPSPGVATCMSAATPRASTIPDTGACEFITPPTLSLEAAMRGPVATIVAYTGTDYTVQELPVAPATEGTPVQALLAGHSLVPGAGERLAVDGGFGVALMDERSSGLIDPVVQRLGCTP